jgi:16S rRNA C967 or C1407 C5-methylase (RsmB/RsmF family)/NOL1/NOP2/fmu family ribosome biogenesis protein
MTDSSRVLPEEFSARMQHQLGEAFQLFQESHRTKPSVSIRLNPEKKTDHSGEPVDWCTNGRYLDERPVFTLDPLFHAGAYYVQEASSMFLEQVFLQLGLTNHPIRILDLSAAPGGKSTHLVNLVHPDSLLVANEVIRSRASILAENLTKWGYNNVMVTNNDPVDFQQLPGFFDVLVVDAPCSGEGLFRKDPEAMKEWSVDQADHCAKRQRRILEDAWSALKADGILVYCTCTYNVDENETNLQWLHQQHSLESLELSLNDSWGIEKNQLGNITGYRFYPHRVRGEGFFISVLRKTDDQKEVILKTWNKVEQPSKKNFDHLSRWLRLPEQMMFLMHSDYIYTIPKSLRDPVLFLSNRLKIVSVGTTVAQQKGEKLIPEHALALSVQLNKENIKCYEVSLDEALSYLRKDTLSLNEYTRGHALVTYQSLPLGWINVLDNRVNNLYPKEWRIRMKAN